MCVWRESGHSSRSDHVALGECMPHWRLCFYHYKKTHTHTQVIPSFMRIGFLLMRIKQKLETSYGLCFFIKYIFSCDTTNKTVPRSFPDADSFVSFPLSSTQRVSPSESYEKKNSTKMNCESLKENTSDITFFLHQILYMHYSPQAFMLCCSPCKNTQFWTTTTR